MADAGAHLLPIAVSAAGFLVGYLVGAAREWWRCRAKTSILEARLELVENRLESCERNLHYRESTVEMLTRSAEACFHGVDEFLSRTRMPEILEDIVKRLERLEKALNRLASTAAKTPRQGYN